MRWAVLSPGHKLSEGRSVPVVGLLSGWNTSLMNVWNDVVIDRLPNTLGFLGCIGGNTFATSSSPLLVSLPTSVFFSNTRFISLSLMQGTKHDYKIEISGRQLIRLCMLGGGGQMHRLHRHSNRSMM